MIHTVSTNTIFTIFIIHVIFLSSLSCIVISSTMEEVRGKAEEKRRESWKKEKMEKK